MAQKKFNFNKVANFFGLLLKAIKSGIEMFVFAVVWVFLFVMELFLYNPITMFFIQLFGPKTAARLCRQKTMSGQWLDDLVHSFYPCLAKPWPYRWKKHWMLHNGVVGSVKEQIRYYNEYNCSLNLLTAEAREELWNLAVAMENSERQTQKKVFTEFFDCDFIDDAKFRTLIANRRYSFIWDMLKEKTPSKDRVAMLLNQALFSDCNLKTSKNYKTAGDEDAMKIVLFVVRRNGLDCDLISDLCALKEHKKEEIKQIEQALDAYAQRVFTDNTSGATPEWQAFCENTSEICPEAQKLMCPEQYAVFLATDHNLDASAIAHFFKKASKDDNLMVQMIMSHEPEHGLISDEIDNIVKSKSILFEALMSELSKK